MISALNHFTIQPHSWRDRWQIFCSTWWLLGREAELQRLVTWASNKRLVKPRQAYQNRLNETQTTLTRIRIRSPQIWALAHFGFKVMNWLFPPPRVMRKGSAAAYRMNLVDYQMKN